MQTPKNLYKTLFISMLLLTMMSVFLFPGSIQASKYSVTIDPLSDSADRTGKKFWKCQPPSDSGGGLSESADWSAGSDQDDAWFGFSIGTAGDVNGDGISDVIVGAVRENKVYVFYGSDSVEGMSTTADWEASGSAGFGCSVGTAGDVNGDGYSDVIVGAYGMDKAYVFHGSANGLPVDPDENKATLDNAAWTAESDQPYAYFGRNVGTAGDVNGDGYSDVIVGAYLEEKAYVFHGSKDGLSESAAWTAESDEADAFFGRSVGTAGDVNGDGYSDVIVGAYGESRAYVFHGSDSDAGLSTTADWEVSGEADSNFGVSVGTAGDVNNDGVSDVIVGAFGEDKTYVFHGSAEGLSLTADWTGEPDQAGSDFGISVGTAGDVNGDGISDVIVGARMYNNSETNDDNGGRTFAYYGSSDAICFITTASYGSPMKPRLSFVTTMALMFFLLVSLIGFMEFRKIKK